MHTTLGQYQSVYTNFKRRFRRRTDEVFSCMLIFCAYTLASNGTGFARTHTTWYPHIIWIYFTRLVYLLPIFLLILIYFIVFCLPSGFVSWIYQLAAPSSSLVFEILQPLLLPSHRYSTNVIILCILYYQIYYQLLVRILQLQYYQPEQYAYSSVHITRARIINIIHQQEKYYA